MGLHDMTNIMAAIKASTLAVAGKISDESLKKQVNDLHDKAALIMQVYRIEADKVAIDGSLSQTGKLEKCRELMTTALAQLEALAASTEALRSEADRLVANAEVETQSENPVLDFLMQQEIRNKIGADDQAEVLYRHAVQNGNNPALVDAFENSPLPYEFVTDGSRAQTRQNKLMKKHPKDATRVKDIDLFTVCLNNTVSAAKGILNQNQ